MKKRNVHRGRIKVRKARRERGGSSNANNAAASTTNAEALKPATIKVKAANQRYRGAREAWYARLKEFDGREAREFLAECKAKPPSTPKSGTAEDPRGWLNWFVRNGVVELEAA